MVHKDICMNILRFNKQFPTEEACEKFLKETREKEGIVCPKCGCVHHYWKGYRKQWQCKKCGHRTGLKAGTVMHGSNLPLMYWFVAIHLLTSTKKSFSAKEMQRQLDHKRYQPIWELMHKLRDVMGQRDATYKLLGSIELDEGFFSTSIEQSEKGKPLKRGRGSQKKTKVLVMAESVPVEDGKRKDIKKAVGHVKMIVIDDLKSKTLDANVIKYINDKAELTTDDSTSYVNFKNIVNSHMSQVVEPKNISKVLPWVHVVISNAKRLLLDIHHDIGKNFLQNYLNEFCYKFNRRTLDLFDRLMTTVVSYRNAFRHKYYAPTFEMSLISNK